MSLDPSYRANPYIVEAGLTDVERWPELAMPISPAPSDEESNPRMGRHGGFSGTTGLKYTTTIMGPSRTGALGLRVTGKRGSISARRASVRRSLSQPPAMPEDEGKEDLDATPTIPSSASPRKADAVQRVTDVEIKVDEPSPDQKSAISAPAVPPPAASANNAPAAVIPIPFIPKFKGAAEMEARRQQRMRNRVPPGGAPTRPQLSAPGSLNPESSSSSSSSLTSSVSDIVDMPEDDDDDFDDDVPDIDVEEDEFDPCVIYFRVSWRSSNRLSREFAGSRGTMLDDVSDGISMLSGGSQSMTSASEFSITHSSYPQGGSMRNNSTRLSPVHESHTNEERSAEVTPDKIAGSPSIDSYFEMVTPAPSDPKKADGKKAPGQLKIPLASTSTQIISPAGNSLFARRPVPVARSGKSALTAMLANEDDDNSENPFTELYSAISGRSEPESMNVRVFFPHAREPTGQTMQLNVRKDASMEEVLGFALWTYWEDGWLPKIDDGLTDEEDPDWQRYCTAIGWIMRIAEDDGEVDEDFPSMLLLFGGLSSLLTLVYSS